MNRSHLASSTDQDLTALMLKKNPNVVETIKRLRRYVGNIKDWNMTEDQRVDFNGKALKVRKLSESIYNSFKVRPISALTANPHFAITILIYCFFTSETLSEHSTECIILDGLHQRSESIQGTHKRFTTRRIAGAHQWTRFVLKCSCDASLLLSLSLSLSRPK